MLESTATVDPRYETILGVRFFTGDTPSAAALGLAGGLVVVPAAPALVELPTNASYREALLQADLAITDSGLMVLVWQLIKGKKLLRVSGLAYLKRLFELKALVPGSTLWIMPGETARDQNLAWLNAQGLAFTAADCYVAPHYPAGPIDDGALIDLLKIRSPRQIVVCLGGGTQERLGLMLKRHCDPTVGIHCIGAAIGFLTGNQVNIPPWADKMFLGWLFRCLSEPGKFIPRYWRAVRLIPMLFRYRDQLPPVRG